MRTKEQFMERFKGVPAHEVARALTSLTPGINWNGCPKGHLAERWVAAEASPCTNSYGRLHLVSLDDIANRRAEIYKRPKP